MRTKTSALALAAALLVAPAAMAQTPAPQPGTSPSPSTAPGMNPPPATTAPASPGTTAPPARSEAPPTTATPTAGANSFTEGQARSRIEAAGFTDVQGLRKDDQGVWRGQAMRGGTRTDVGVDFRGNVVIGNAPAAAR